MDFQNSLLGNVPPRSSQKAELTLALQEASSPVPDAAASSPPPWVSGPSTTDGAELLAFTEDGCTLVKLSFFTVTQLAENDRIFK